VAGQRARSKHHNLANNRPDQLAIWVRLVEACVADHKTFKQIAEEFNVSQTTVSYVMDYYMPGIPDNPVTIVLQSKINKPENPED
jgi:FixJ family two-component response regulator